MSGDRLRFKSKGDSKICGFVYKNRPEERSGLSRKLSSASFRADGDIPSKFTCDSPDIPHDLGHLNKPGQWNCNPRNRTAKSA
jgi:hypothetical protein